MAKRYISSRFRFYDMFISVTADVVAGGTGAAVATDADGCSSLHGAKGRMALTFSSRAAAPASDSTSH